MPYQVLGASSGTLALTIACSRAAMPRSGSGILAIAASTSLSPSALPRADFVSRTRSRIASRSSFVNPPEALGVLAADDLPAFAVFFPAMVSSFNLRSEEHTSELQSPVHLVCRLLLEKKKKIPRRPLLTPQHYL